VSAGGTSPTGSEGGDMPDGSTTEDTARAALERRYLRLLRCCPPSHREVHREEMLGVLVATARPGQPMPGARQLFLGSLLFAVLVWPAAIASWRGRVRRASRAG
jgi:hypothetical protein